jgi:hypothetical protein
MKLKKLRIPFSVWFAINFLARQRRIIPHFPGLSAEAFSFACSTPPGFIVGRFTFRILDALPIFSPPLMPLFTVL